MNRTQFACYALIASSLALAGLLVVRVQDRLLSSAQASNLVSKDTYTFLTARTQNGQESLFVTDNVNQKLLIYDVKLSGSQGRLDISRVVDLSQLFDLGGKAGGGNHGGGTVPDRVRP